jgi:hypothetical protein
MMKILISVFLALLFFGCEKIVEIEDPLPTPVEQCAVGADRTGRWISDSVHIQTEIDSLDSIMVNDNPAFYYLLNVRCDSVKLFELNYVNFSGVTSREVSSTNYSLIDNAYYIFGEQSQKRDSADAEFVISTIETSDSTLIANYKSELNKDQRSTYTIYFRKY